MPAVSAYLPWHTFSVASAGMEPTLRLGEIFLADTLYFEANSPGRGDVVVYSLPREPDTIHVKRIVALPGDRVAPEDALANARRGGTGETHQVESPEVAGAEHTAEDGDAERATRFFDGLHHP